MSASPSFRSTATEFAYSVWLVFDDEGGVKLYRTTPGLSPRQRAMQVEVRLPKALWQIPALTAEIAVPDLDQPAAIKARVDSFAEQLRSAVGCDVVLTVTTPEDKA